MMDIFTKYMVVVPIQVTGKGILPESLGNYYIDTFQHPSNSRLEQEDALNFQRGP